MLIFLFFMINYDNALDDTPYDVEIIFDGEEHAVNYLVNGNTDNMEIDIPLDMIDGVFMVYVNDQVVDDERIILIENKIIVNYGQNIESVKLMGSHDISGAEPEPIDGIFYPRYHVSIFDNPKTMGQYITNDFITIGPHSQVTWSYYGDASVTLHSKNSDDQWDTGVILPQGYATVTFNKTGIYEYCEDSRINGVIVVMDDDGELLSSKFSDVFGNGSPLMYTEGLEPVLLYDNCKRYAYWLSEHQKEKIDLYEDYPRYPPWGNQIFPLVDFCVTNGDLVKTISGDHYRWEFQLENEN